MLQISYRWDENLSVLDVSDKRSGRIGVYCRQVIGGLGKDWSVFHVSDRRLGRHKCVACK